MDDAIWAAAVLLIVSVALIAWGLWAIAAMDWSGLEGVPK